MLAIPNVSLLWSIEIAAVVEIIMSRCALEGRLED
jgi:hypothetical protein